MAKRDRTEIFESIPVRRAVFMQIVPAIASQMIVLLYNLADTYFVGLLNEPSQTAAVTIGYSPFLLLTAISNLFGVGGASAVARALGRKQGEEAKQISSVSFWYGLFCACFFSVFFFIFRGRILTLCGAQDEVFRIAENYTFWVVVVGGPATVLNTLLANLIRAEGSAGTASFGVSFGGILNMILDPFFVLPGFLGFGAAGAGVATAVSNYAAAAYFLIGLIRRRKTSAVRISPRDLRYTGKHMKDILAVGFPSAVQYALTVLAIAAQARFVSNYATEAVAGLGIIKKLDQLPLYFSIGVANGLLPLLAYNYASGNHARRQKAFRLGCAVSLSFSVFCLVIYELFAPQLAGLFIDNELTVRYSAVFLRIMVTAMPMMSVCYPMIIQFQAMGKAKESLVCSVLRKGLLDIPLLYLLDSLLPLYGCMWVQPIVDTISLIVACALYFRMKRQGRGADL